MVDINDGVSIVMDQLQREFDKYVCGSFMAPGFRSTNRYWSGSCLRLRVFSAPHLGVN